MAPRPVSLARDGCKIRELPLTTLSKTASAIVERSEQLRRRHRDPVMIFRDMDEGNVWRAANLLVQRHSIMAEVIAAMGSIEPGNPAGESARERVSSVIKTVRRAT